MNKGYVVQKMLSGKIFLEYLNHHCKSLTLKTAIQNCHTTLGLMMMDHYTKFGCKSFRNSGDMDESYFCRIWPRSVTLTLKLGTQPFRITLQVMVMHYHTKFGCIQFSGSEDNNLTDRGVIHRQTDNLVPIYPRYPRPLTSLQRVSKSILRRL